MRFLKLGSLLLIAAVYAGCANTGVRSPAQASDYYTDISNLCLQYSGATHPACAKSLGYEAILNNFQSNCVGSSLPQCLDDAVTICKEYTTSTHSVCNKANGLSTVVGEIKRQGPAYDAGSGRGTGDIGSSTDEVKVYCGWIDNPGPANASMEDNQGLLYINEQGGHQAQGDLGDIKFQYYVNGDYGTTCGCITAQVSISGNERVVEKIISSKQLPISKCQNDKAIKSGFRPIILVHSTGKAFTSCVQENESQIIFDKPVGGRKACVNDKNEYYYLAN